MKVWKRFGAALVALMVLASMLTGTALAAEPENGGISVQLNGAQVPFTDAVPEISNGRTFVPLRAVMEAMDAQVDYDGATRTVSIHRGGADLTMVLGQNQAAVVEDGQTRTITMDVTPYVRDGRTYVPVRFVAEAVGCNVGWDAKTRTVIIVDVDALFGDATFTLMDNLAAYSNKQGEIENMALTGNLTIDVNDKSGEELTGPLKIKGSLEGVVSEKGVQLTGKIDGSAIAATLGSALGGAVDAEALQSLAEISAELRAGLDTKMLYVSLPAILTGESADTWYSLDWSALETELLSLIDMEQLAQLQDAGVREALVAVLQSLPLEDSASSYETIALLVNTYKSMLSDQAFTQKGDTYVAQTTVEDIMDVTVTLTKKGDDIVAADIKMNCDVDESGTKVAMTMDMHATTDKVDMVMELSIEDEGMAVACRLDFVCAPTDKTPVTTLPSGVQAIPLA